MVRVGMRRCLAIVLAAALVTSTACTDSKGAEAPAGGGYRVKYQTGFGTEGRDAYVWLALEKGYFREEGIIDVEIQPGVGGDNLKNLAGGASDFTLIDYAGAIERQGKGNFGDFCLIASITAQTLIAIMTIEGRGIDTPADFEGRKIAVSKGTAPKTLFPLYAKRMGIDATKVTIEEGDKASVIAALVAGKVDAIGQFTVGLPNVRAQAKQPIKVFPYSQAIGDLYGNVLVTTKKTARENPDLARRFARALIKGLLYAKDDPEEAAQSLKKHHPMTNEAIAKEEMELLGRTIGTREGAPPGTFSEPFAARGIAALQSQELIPAAFMPTDFIDFSVMGGPNASAGGCK